MIDLEKARRVPRGGQCLEGLHMSALRTGRLYTPGDVAAFGVRGVAVG